MHSGRCVRYGLDFLLSLRDSPLANYFPQDIKRFPEIMVMEQDLNSQGLYTVSHSLEPDVILHIVKATSHHSPELYVHPSSFSFISRTVISFFLTQRHCVIIH